MFLTTNPGSRYRYRNHLGKVLTFLLLVLVTTTSHAQATNGNKRKIRSGKKMKIIRNSGSYRGTKLQYVEITGGYGIWIQAAQTGFENVDTPLFGSIEYGNTLSPLSFGLGASIGNQLNRDSISLNPQYAFAFAKYRISQLVPSLPSGLEVYGLAGASAWRADLDNFATETSEFSIPGNQKDQGVGMILGAGIQYRYREIGVGAQFLWITGKGNYQLADATEVGVLTGTKQLHVVLSYRLVWGRKKINCPIYSK